MEWFAAPEYWYGRLIFQRGLAVIYAVAFLTAALQFRALLGERGMLPIPRFLERSSWRRSPSLFHLRYSDRLFAAVSWTGVVLAVAVAAGLADAVPLWAGMLLWFALWVLYLSIVNVGQLWYGFGWESLLLEAGFLAIFLGNDTVAPPLLVLLAARWLLFRVEFGAGLIKLRGDPCWRDLTCLYYHHETQPMPGPLSWFFHHLPKPLHKVEVAANHFAQLIVPFGLFAPQPVASIAAAIVIVTQLWLVLSGNFAWLNWVTLLLAATALSLPGGQPAPAAPGWFVGVCIAYVAVVVVASYRPVRNMLSPNQQMNASFDPLHLVNTYGAFGSIGRTRYEIVLEGTDDTHLTDDTVWREYAFKGKPGDPRRMPRQFAPYHLRLDWLMWFAAISPAYARSWALPLTARLLRNDPDTLRLLGPNPFPDAPPHYVRAHLYEYEFSTPAELFGQRIWWRRTLIGEFLPPLTRDRLNRY
ncbi:lipase maturation factor family protein [Nocardia rosealba]|uniref:lipase maturation factor family protein n=1 Tax=Nocardia rosealba TaxID=2878563 RepID=UPI001CD96039|nr:lipase maturation factor family protein [Nocardia rosealba]MCA2209952.1 lipase maturation factor family protein [Nocardia rosealba]